MGWPAASVYIKGRRLGLVPSPLLYALNVRFSSGGYHKPLVWFRPPSSHSLVHREGVVRNFMKPVAKF